MNHRHDSQRGAATLAVAVMLAAAMILAALYVNRHLLAEQRSATQQVRTTQAFEAAEAGLEWALAQLNRPERIGTDCRPSAASPASFRERSLVYQARTGRFVPAAATAACVRNAAGWTCACPTEGVAAPAVDDDGAPHPGFAVTLLAGDRPGTVRVRSQGCSHFVRPCASTGSARSEAIAQVEATLALLPGVAQPPAAALTVRGSVATSAALGVHNADPRSGGIALHTGGDVQAGALRLTAPAGSPQAAAFLANDDRLAGATPQALFGSAFGTTRTVWRDLPMTRRLACSGECGAELLAAIGDGVQRPLIAVDGDLHVDGPLTIGTPQRPVVLVVAGAVRFSGAVQLHGLIHAAALQWDDTPPHGALLRGGAIVEGDYTGTGAPDIARDTDVLDLLRGNTGSFVRAGGGWRDF